MKNKKNTLRRADLSKEQRETLDRLSSRRPINNDRRKIFARGLKDAYAFLPRLTEVIREGRLEGMRGMKELPHETLEMILTVVSCYQLLMYIIMDVPLKALDEPGTFEYETIGDNHPDGWVSVQN